MFIEYIYKQKKEDPKQVFGSIVPHPHVQSLYRSCRLSCLEKIIKNSVKWCLMNDETKICMENVLVVVSPIGLSIVSHCLQIALILNYDIAPFHNEWSAHHCPHTSLSHNWWRLWHFSTSNQRSFTLAYSHEARGARRVQAHMSPSIPPGCWRSNNQYRKSYQALITSGISNGCTHTYFSNS